jgi:hypothetical protein
VSASIYKSNPPGRKTAYSDKSGKGVAASMMMAQLHALFRSLTGISLSVRAGEFHRRGRNS